ncbi:MAG: L-rhamnose mutarotase [Pseudomonadota bacterium]
MPKIDAVFGPTNPPPDDGVQRFGSVVGLRPDAEAQYRALHANVWEGVVRRLRKSGIRNYSIFVTELDGKKFLFSYFEYHGHDLDADLAAIREDPETQRWWEETDPCQIRLPSTPSDQQWLPLERLFFSD